MNMEKHTIWKDVPDYEGIYQISNYGEVKSLSRPVLAKSGGIKITEDRILKPSINSVGYKQVVLRKDSENKTFSIHCLLAMGFMGYIKGSKGLVVDHIDNDKLNNNLDNLQIITNRHNTLKEVKSKYTNLKGANWHSKNKSWTASIVINGKSKHLGTFKSDVDAHKVYMIEFNKLNTI